MDLPLFEHVGELTRTLVNAEHGSLHFRSHRRGVKVWFGSADKPTRFHYEAQVIPRLHVDGADGAALEVGFHAEHPDDTRNTACLAHLASVERTWRKPLGPEAEAGPFLGNAHWCRVSETWLDVEIDDDPELAFELASRLADYVNSLQGSIPPE